MACRRTLAWDFSCSFLPERVNDFPAHSFPIGSRSTIHIPVKQTPDSSSHIELQLKVSKLLTVTILSENVLLIRLQKNTQTHKPTYLIS